MNITKVLCLSVCLLVTSYGASAAASASSTAAPPDDLRAILELMRSDLNTYKIHTINRVMEMTAPEADKFWPIYRAYEKELSAVADRRLALIREFAGLRNSKSISQDTWDTMASRWLKIEQDRLALWKKYQKKIAKAVSPARAAQFLQVEHQIALFVDLNIASEMPVLSDRLILK